MIIIIDNYLENLKYNLKKKHRLKNHMQQFINKVMIIDQKKLITGSFNFTNAADKRNAENVLLIDDDNLAKLYIDNWKSRVQQNKK